MKPRPQPSPDAVPDRGADGPAAMARESRIRAIEVEGEGRAGYAQVDVREYRDVLAVDRLLNKGLITPDEHAAGVALLAAWKPAYGKRVTGLYGGTGGSGEPIAARERWAALIGRVPARYQNVVISVCCADDRGQMPTSDRMLLAVKAGLACLAPRDSRPPDATIRAAWAGPPETREEG